MIDYFEYDQNASLAKNVLWHSKYIEQLQKSLELKSKAILKNGWTSNFFLPNFKNDSGGHYSGTILIESYRNFCTGVKKKVWKG